MPGENESSAQNTTSSSGNYKYTIMYQRVVSPTPEKQISPKQSSIILSACRENPVPSQPPLLASQSIVVKPNHVVTVGRSMTSSEVCLIELQSARIRTEQKSSACASQNLVAEPDLTKTSETNSSSEQTSSTAPAEKKSNIILPASRESLVPLQPPQTSYKPPVRISPAFPTAPKVMVRTFNLAYNSQTNTHLQNKLSMKARVVDGDPKELTSETVNSELCIGGGKLQLTKISASELSSLVSSLEQPSEAGVTNSMDITTLAVDPPANGSQKTSACSPLSGIPLKLVPTILKRSPAKTVLTPSGSGSAGSIPSAGPQTPIPVIIMNNKGASVTTAINKPVVSLAGKSVVTKDKVFNIKMVDGKYMLYENVNSKTAAVSDVLNEPKVMKQVDLKMLRTPKLIKVDSHNGSYILKRCIQSHKDMEVTVPKQPNMSVISEKRPQEHIAEVVHNPCTPVKDGGSELVMSDTSEIPVEPKSVPSSNHVSHDAVGDSLEWDANEILKTLDGGEMETRHNIEKHEKQVKQVIEGPSIREIEIPARKILVVDAWSQTELFSLMEPGKIVQMSITPAAKYGSGSLVKKQTVPVTSAPVAVVERIPPVNCVVPCVQAVQHEAKKAKLDVKGTDECFSINPNKNSDTSTAYVHKPKFPESQARKEIEPTNNTANNIDSNTLWQDLMNNCSATEIEPDQLLMETEILPPKANALNGHQEKSSVLDLIVKHNINKLCNKNKLVKNDGPSGEEYYKPNSRKRKQTFPTFTNQKPGNYVKRSETNTRGKEIKSPNVNSVSVNNNSLLEDPKMIDLLTNKRLLQKLYYEWMESVHPDSGGNIELHYAVTEENVSLVQRQCMVISARKLSVDIKNNEGETPLHLAVRNGHKQITQILLRYGADPCVKNDSGNTALHLAVLADSVGSLRALLARDSLWTLPLDVLNDEGLSSLHLCAMNNKNKQLLELLAAGANVNLEDAKSGRTALFHAVEADNNQIVRILLAAGADSSLQNYSGHTPLHAASEVSVTDKRVMSVLITSEGIAANGNNKKKKKAGSKCVKSTDVSDDEDDPKCLRSRVLRQ